jgi:predicted ATPase
MLEHEVESAGATKRFQFFQRPDEGLVTIPQPQSATDGRWFTTGTPDLTLALSYLSRLKQQGHDSQVRDLIRRIDERIEGLEILAPTGSQASIFVRVSGEPMLLPLQMMGDGVQRCFDFAVVLAGGDSAYLAIDEIENGLHHSVLEPVWNWLAEVSALHKIQIFATTHSEECVQTACRAFSALNDDGLRVIRLDRQEHQTVATVYDRNLVEAAERMGIEIRG